MNTEQQQIKCAQLQDIYLSHAIRSQNKFQVYTVNGTCLKGRILEYDYYTIKISTPWSTLGSLIYKHSITSINESIEKDRE